MTAKSILLCYGERRKVCSVDWDAFRYEEALKKAISCYPTLATRFGKAVFQRYDKGWNEWIDMEEGNEINDRDRLNIVLVAHLSDIYLTADNAGCQASTSACETDFKSHHQIQPEPIRHEEVCPPSASEIDDHASDISTGHQLEQPNEDTANDADTSICNFSLPSTFPSCVEAQLHKKKFLVGTPCSQFVQTVAHSMLAITRYPSSDEFESVARKIIFTYPFLASKLESGFWVKKLRGIFKRFRRIRHKPAEVLPPPPPPKRPRKKAKAASLLLEDENLYRIRLRNLRNESEKKNPNKALVKKLMALTFSQRRSSFLMRPLPVKNIVVENPFLGREKEVSDELRRIWKKEENCSFANSWKKWIPKILKFAQLQGGKDVEEIMKGVSLPEKLGREDVSREHCLLAFRLLPVFFPAAKSLIKKTPTMIKHCKEDDDVDRFVQDTEEVHPFVVLSEKGAFVASEKLVLFCVDDPVNIPSSLLAVYFAFNIKYLAGHKSILFFLEYIMRGRTHEKLTMTCESMLAALTQLPE